MKLDQTLLNQIIKKHFKDTVNLKLQEHAVSGRSLQDTLENIDVMIDQAKDFLQKGNHHLLMLDHLKRLSKELGIELGLDTEDGKLLGFHLCKAEIQAMERSKALLQNEDALADELQPTPAQAISEPQQTVRERTLQELITKYRDHQLSTGTWREGSARDAQPKLNALISFFGKDRPISKLSFDDMESYLKLLQALPPNFSKLKAFRGVELHELDPIKLCESHTKQLSVTTVRDYMTMTRSIFGYAVDLGLIEKNPCPSLLIPKKQKGSAREQIKAYTREQLETIFNPDTFLPWVKGDPARLLVGPIMAVTACRLEEVCGLRASDVLATDEGVSLNIEPWKERELKNASSERVIPVAPVIADRLLQYAQSLSEGSRLFPQLSKAHGKFSHNFGRNWGRYVRRVGIDDPQISPAHSFRHYTIDLLFKALVPPQVVKAFDGHSPGHGETGQRYAKGLEVETLRKECLPVIERELGGALRPLISAL